MPIQTMTERLVLEIIVCKHFSYCTINITFSYQKSRQPDWDNIYGRHKILLRTNEPIKSPLLALPYGKPKLPSEDL